VLQVIWLWLQWWFTETSAPLTVALKEAAAHYDCKSWHSAVSTDFLLPVDGGGYGLQWGWLTLGRGQKMVAMATANYAVNTKHAAIWKMQKCIPKATLSKRE
jgi:hypothetical protein